MAQGKTKVKTKPPPTKKTKGGKVKKGPASQRRGNAPILPKHAKFQEAYKLKKMLTKTVNEAMEKELREKAFEGKKSMSKKEKPEAPKK